jgi:hypothetical protein
MKVYKLTDKNNQTRNDTQWGPNTTHTAKGDAEKLCSDGWIHFYTNPLIAVLMNPVHANFKYPRLWECETSGAELYGALKSGCKTLKMVKEIPIPEIALTQRIAFGILCAKEFCKDKSWSSWADKWLSGEDRSKESAIAAATAAAHAATAHAVIAAYAAYAVSDAAVSDASDASNASDAAAYAVSEASDAAVIAATAVSNASAVIAAHAVASTATHAAHADTNHSIDFIKFAEKALTYK